MSVWTTDALVDGLASGVELDPGIASFIRAFVALMLIIFLIVFFVEMLVVNHMLTFGVLIGQVAIAMRPVRPLRGVSGQMIRNVVTLSLVPTLGVASLALSLGRLNDAGALSFQRSMGALAGIVVSVLMPLVVAKFLPLGGQSSSVGRSLIGAGAQVAATGAAVRPAARCSPRVGCRSSSPQAVAAQPAAVAAVAAAAAVVAAVEGVAEVRLVRRRRRRQDSSSPRPRAASPARRGRPVG